MTRYLLSFGLTLALSLGCEPGSSATIETVAGGPAEGFADGPGETALLGPPSGIAVTTDGTLYVADTFNAAIRRISPDGEVLTVAGGEEGFADGVGEAARFNRPSGLALDGDDTLYVADAFNAVIRRVDLRTGEVTTVVGRAGEPGHVDGSLDRALLHGPFDVDVEPSTGRLWIVDSLANAVRIADLRSNQVLTVAGGSGGTRDGEGAEAQFNRPAGIACDGEGGAWITDRMSNTIRSVSAAGFVSTVVGSPLRSGFRDGAGGEALLNRPSGIARTDDGELVFADQENNVLRSLTPDDGVRTLAGSQYRTDSLGDALPRPTDGPASTATLRDPRGVTVAADAIFFTDLYAVRVYREDQM